MEGVLRGTEPYRRPDDRNPQAVRRRIPPEIEAHGPEGFKGGKGPATARFLRSRFAAKKLNHRILRRNVLARADGEADTERGPLALYVARPGKVGVDRLEPLGI